MNGDNDIACFLSVQERYPHQRNICHAKRRRVFPLKLPLPASPGVATNDARYVEFARKVWDWMLTRGTGTIIGVNAIGWITSPRL